MAVRPLGLRRFTSDLLGAGLTQHRFEALRVALGTAHHQAELVARKARAIPAQRLEGRQIGEQHPSDQRRNAAEQHHQLEADDAVGGDRRDRLAARHQIPFERSTDGQDECGDYSRDASQQHVPAHETGTLIDGFVDMLARDGREHPKPGLSRLELPDTVDQPLFLAKRSDQFDFRAHAAFAYPWRSACLSQVMPSFNSVIEMIGMYRANSENSITNHAKLPTVIITSVTDGCQKRQVPGSKLTASEPAIMTKRSNHIPMLMKIVMMKSGIGLVRMVGENRNSGITQLHATITQNIQPQGPK